MAAQLGMSACFEIMSAHENANGNQGPKKVQEKNFRLLCHEVIMHTLMKQELDKVNHSFGKYLGFKTLHDLLST